MTQAVRDKEKTFSMVFAYSGNGVTEWGLVLETNNWISIVTALL